MQYYFNSISFLHTNSISKCVSFNLFRRGVKIWAPLVSMYKSDGSSTCSNFSDINDKSLFITFFVSGQETLILLFRFIFSLPNYKCVHNAIVIPPIWKTLYTLISKSSLTKISKLKADHSKSYSSTFEHKQHHTKTPNKQKSCWSKPYS